MSDLNLGELKDIGQVLAGIKEGKAKEYTVIALLGGKDSGKTSLINAFIRGSWEPTSPTQTFLDMKNKSIEVNGKRIEVVFCDYAGSKDFRLVQKTMFPPTRAVPVKCLLTVDLSRRESQSELIEIIDSLVVPRLASKNPPAAYLLAGCKADLKRSTSQPEISSLINAVSTKLGKPVQYIETSAKEGKNVPQAFEILVSKGK
jgi:small GTP-binding protein